MKFKEFGPRRVEGGGVRVPGAPLDPPLISISIHQIERESQSFNKLHMWMEPSFTVCIKPSAQSLSFSVSFSKQKQTTFLYWF